MAIGFPISAPPFALTEAATIAVDAAAGRLLTVTLTSSRIMGAPTNPKDGEMIMFKIKQGGAGSFTITSWTSGAGGYQFSASIPAPTLSTTAGLSDYIGFIYDSVSNRWNCLSYSLGFA